MMDMIDVNKIQQLVSDCLYGLPLCASTFTVRKEWDCESKDGIGMKKIKNAMKSKYGLEVDKDYEIYTLASEGDRCLHINFKEKVEDVELKFFVSNV